MKCLIKHCAIMLLMSTTVSTALKGMENPNKTVTVRNRYNNDKSRLQLRYTSDNGHERSITLNAPFIFKLSVKPSSSLEILDPRNSHGMTISAEDNDIIIIEKEHNHTIQIKNNGQSIGHFTTSKKTNKSSSSSSSLSSSSSSL